jgi:acyl carrier protein
MPTLDDTTKNLVKNLIGDILELSPSSLSSTSNLVEDHGADSLAMARIVTALEKTLQVTIDYSDMRRMVTLQGACDVVVDARARKGVSRHQRGTGGEPVAAARPNQPPLRWSTRPWPRPTEGPRSTGHGGTQPPMVMSEHRS